MKNSVTVSAVVLILTFCFVGSAIALERPYDDPLRPGGDDHPWGGGNQVITNPTIINSTKTPSLTSTGYMVIDLVVNGLFTSSRFQAIFMQTEEREVYRGTVTRTRNFSEKGAR